LEKPTEPMPSVLIIVLNWMKYEDTINCVNSLLKLSYPDFKIMLVDNHSLNESVQVLEKIFPDILLVKSSENNGYAAGNKIGVDYALKNNFDAVWILNNDCTVRQESLFELVQSYKRNGNALYSNLTLLSENPNVIHYAGTYEIDEALQPDKYPTYDKLKGKLLEEYKNLLIEKPARIYGHSMFIPVEVIKKYGFMDTRYFMFCEETDYTLSLHKIGIPSIFVPTAIITHISTSTFKLSDKMKYVGVYYGIRNTILFDKKFGKSDYKAVLSRKGGWVGLCKYFMKFYLSSSSFKNEEFYTNLGFLHALIGIRGKRLNPEELL
jgi:GT2 family glycosyltransferase